ncbi:MAG TPA: sulfatase-like hydrolase/transferase [Pirellulales bacterium]|nr:sulfatase-like hydrolase/transferase [Pirellulales bacterium]
MTTRRLLAFVALLIVGAGAHAADRSRPNVVFILLDDLGWGDLHCYGHPYAKTPNIDRLADEGLRFLQCYATGVTCCPSRTGFMTSKFPATYPVYPAAGGFALRPTITALLKQQGYATGHFGKWHIGPDTAPGTYGIDTIGSEQDDAGGKKKRRNTSGGRDSYIYDDAIAFIEQHRDEPFYVNVWGHIPHHPIDPSSELLEAFGPLSVDESKFPPEMQSKFAYCKKLGGDVNQHMRAYLADVKSADDDVGRLLRRLDELGLRETTIVAVSSDQGCAGAAEVEEQKKKRKAVDGDDNRLNAMGYPGPFRGGKHSQLEGGVRIPFIVRWPGHVPSARVDKESVISGADWLPTLCRIAGVKIDAGDFDGEDASAAWLGQSTHVRNKPLLWKTSATNSDPAIRDGQWKLHGSHRRRGTVELYDVVADPGEHRNLAAGRPDIAQALTAKLDAWVATLPKSYVKSDDRDD